MNPSADHSSGDRLSINAAEAAAILAVGLATVNRWSLLGYLPAVQRGARGRRPWLYDRAAVERLAADRRAALATLGKVAA